MKELFKTIAHETGRAFTSKPEICYPLVLRWRTAHYAPEGKDLKDLEEVFTMNCSGKNEIDKILRVGILVDIHDEVAVDNLKKRIISLLKEYPDYVLWVVIHEKK